jgi:hypothetical protein
MNPYQLTLNSLSEAALQVALVDGKARQCETSGLLLNWTPPQGVAVTATFCGRDSRVRERSVPCVSLRPLPLLSADETRVVCGSYGPARGQSGFRPIWEAIESYAQHIFSNFPMIRMVA